MLTKLLSKIKAYFLTVVEVPTLEEKQLTKEEERAHILVLKILIAFCIIIIITFLMYIFTNQNNTSLGKITNDVVVSTKISNKEFLNKVAIGKISDIISALDMGAEPNAKDETGRNAFIIAAISDVKPEVINVLKSYGTRINDVDINGYNASMYSILSNGTNSQAYIDNLLKAGINVNSKTKSGISTLMLAVSTTNNMKIIEALIKSGADVNYMDGNRVTPLMLAAKMTKNPEIISLLLKNKANKYIKDTNGVTAYDNLLTNQYLRDNKKLAKLLK